MNNCITSWSTKYTLNTNSTYSFKKKKHTGKLGDHLCLVYSEIHIKWFGFFSNINVIMTWLKSCCSYLPVSLHQSSSDTGLTPPLPVDAVFLPVQAPALPVQAPPLPESLCSAVCLGAHQRRGLHGCRSQKMNRGQGWTVLGPRVSSLTGRVHHCQGNSCRTLPKWWEQWLRRWPRGCVALCLCLHLALLFFLLIPGYKN